MIHLRAYITSSGAEFSALPERAYRYALWRVWNSGGPFMMFIGLNPSTADETANDPTVERMMRRADRLGFGGLHVCNLFAIRGTDPAIIRKRGALAVSEGATMRNDEAILGYAAHSALIICGWGSHGTRYDRGTTVLQLLRSHGCKPHALKINQDGTPAHPLYLPYSAMPKAMA